MIVYIIIAVVLIINIINPRILWYIDSWKYKDAYIDGMIRVYNDEICDTIDNYNSSAYYEPSYVITRAYNNVRHSKKMIQKSNSNLLI